MKNIICTFLLTTISILVYTKETIPYIVIEDVDNPLFVIEPTIELVPGQNVSFKCYTNRYNDNGVFWTHRNNKLKLSDGVLKFHGLSKTDEGLYLCVSPSTKLTKEIRIIVKNLRVKRYNDVDSSGSETNPYELEDSIMHTNEKQDEPQSWWFSRPIYVVLGIGASVFFGCLLLFTICVICKRMSERNRRNPHPMNYAYATPPVTHSRTNNWERRALNGASTDTSDRPTETHIPLYPPPASAISPPTQFRSNRTVANSECLPPPSYDEALSNAGPSAPPLLGGRL